MTDHPITPPPELVQQWHDDNRHLPSGLFALGIATQAARWGADQELEECCKWLPKLPPWSADDLRKHRRPQPPNLKEQALEALYQIESEFPAGSFGETIRRALEALPND